MRNDMRDRLVELLQDTLCEWECDVQIKTVLQIAEHLVENGVVPVVRCKDCKHSNDDGTICRYSVGRAVEPEHFCSYGTPKERGGEK